jgi:hypothetical protein
MRVTHVEHKVNSLRVKGSTIDTGGCMAASKRYKFFGGRRVPLTLARELFASPYDSCSSIQHSEVIKAAATCLQFDTLEGHEHRLQELCKGSPIEGHEWRPHLDRARDCGVLVSEESILKLVERRDAADKPARRISRIAIPTRNRPEMLRRILAQIAGRSSQELRDLSLVVVDSSESEAVQQANREIVAEVGSSGRFSTRYAGQASRAEYSRRLSETAGVPPWITRFAIAPADEGLVSTGSCRNALLLEAQGEHVLFLDDDVHWMTTPIPESASQLEWGANKEAFGIWFLPVESHLNDLPYRSDNLLDLHEDTLNWRRVDNQGADSVEHLSQHLLSRLQADGMDVLVSSLGVVGDPGTDSPMSFLLGGSDTLQRLFADDLNFARATHERLVLQGPRSLILSDDIGCMSYCMAVDNSAILPPFCPLQRAAEFVFAALVQQCLPNALFAAIPHAILHAPAVRRRFDDHAIVNNAGRFTAGELLVALIKRHRVLGSSRPEAIRSVGNYLGDIALLDDVAFQRLVREVVSPLIAQWVQIFDGAVHLFCASLPRTAEELRRAQQSALEILNARNAIVPLDMEAHWGSLEGYKRFRLLISNFGQLLRVWPALIEANDCLRRQGYSLCESDDESQRRLHVSTQM